MHSTWLDNDHAEPQKRLESAAKKLSGNRIQVQHANLMQDIEDGSQHQHGPEYDSPSTNAQYLNQTCVERFGGAPLRRANTAEDVLERNQRDRNLLKLMQQQLELVKNNYQEKIRQQLKQTNSQLSKLKIKIQNNNQLIAAKDQQIQMLVAQIRRSSPSKQLQFSNKGGPQPFPPIVSQKINQIQAKFTMLMETHHRLSQKIMQIGSKVQYVEKGLLSILACKLTSSQLRITQFIDVNTLKLTNIQMNFTNRIKKQPIFNSTIVKNGQLQPSNFQFQSNIDAAMRGIQGLRQQVAIFKNKQFRYQNSHIKTLKKDVHELKNVVNQLQRKFNTVHHRLKSSKTSSRRNYQSDKKNTSVNLSSYFDDYQQVYDEIDSLGQDQFFHPLQQSSKKFSKQSIQPTHHKSKPTIHNDSFQNFTGDQQQEQNLNEKRLIHAIRVGGFKVPVPIEIDLTGYIRKKSDQKYIFDEQKKAISLTTLQLNSCRQKGWITW